MLPGDAKVDVNELKNLIQEGKTIDYCMKKFKVHYRVIKRLMSTHEISKPPYRGIIKKCQYCGKEFRAERNSKKYCSEECRSNDAMISALDPDLIKLMYYRAFMSQGEIAKRLGVTQKVISQLMKRNGIKARTPHKRFQKGSQNSSWKGEEIGYKGAHDRVRLKRGAPKECLFCGATSDTTILEWANVNGRYHDPNDYIPLCVKCHRNYDLQRRKKGVK